MQSFIEDPFWNEQETLNFTNTSCSEKPRSSLFFQRFFCFFLVVNVTTVRLIMSHRLTLVVENKSIEYLQNLVNFEIKTVHLHLHWKWGLV